MITNIGPCYIFNESHCIGTNQQTLRQHSSMAASPQENSTLMDFSDETQTLESWLTAHEFGEIFPFLNEIDVTNFSDLLALSTDDIIEFGKELNSNDGFKQLNWSLKMKVKFKKELIKLCDMYNIWHKNQNYKCTQNL